MAFPTFTQIVSTFQTSLNSYVSGLANFNVGGVLNALGNAYSQGIVDFEAHLTRVLLNTRAQTADNHGLDTFFAQFPGFARLPAVTATTVETFTPTVATPFLIVPGLTLKTIDGTLNFVVTEDDTNPDWNADQGGYLAGVGNAVSVPITANAAGTAYNVQANTITLISGSLAGFQGTLTNLNPVTNGVDAETNEQALPRFWQYFVSLREGTKAAIQYAIGTVQQGLTFSFVPNGTADGSIRPGFFSVYIDDGSGSPSTALQESVYGAVLAVVAFPITFAVFPCTSLEVSVSLSVNAKPGYNQPSLIAPVQSAIEAVINSTGVGNTLYYSQVMAAATSVDGVGWIENLTLNGFKNDVVAGVSDSVHSINIAAS